MRKAQKAKERRLKKRVKRKTNKYTLQIRGRTSACRFRSSFNRLKPAHLHILHAHFSLALLLALHPQSVPLRQPLIVFLALGFAVVTAAPVVSVSVTAVPTTVVPSIILTVIAAPVISGSNFFC